MFCSAYTSSFCVTPSLVSCDRVGKVDNVNRRQFPIWGKKLLRRRLSLFS